MQTLPSTFRCASGGTKQAPPLFDKLQVLTLMSVWMTKCSSVSPQVSRGTSCGVWSETQRHESPRIQIGHFSYCAVCEMRCTNSPICSSIWAEPSLDWSCCRTSSAIRKAVRKHCSFPTLSVLITAAWVPFDWNEWCVWRHPAPSPRVQKNKNESKQCWIVMKTSGIPGTLTHSNRLAALLHCVSVLLCLSPLRPFILCLRPRGAAGICSPLPTGMGPTGTPVAGGLKDITVCVCVCMCQSVLKTELHRCEWREVSENEREACRTGGGTCSRRKVAAAGRRWRSFTSTLWGFWWFDCQISFCVLWSRDPAGEKRRKERKKSPEMRAGSWFCNIKILSFSPFFQRYGGEQAARRLHLQGETTVQL